MNIRLNLSWMISNPKELLVIFFTYVGLEIEYSGVREVMWRPCLVPYCWDITFQRVKKENNGCLRVHLGLHIGLVKAIVIELVHHISVSYALCIEGRQNCREGQFLVTKRAEV